MTIVPFRNKDGIYQPRAFLMATVTMASSHLEHVAKHIATHDDVALRRSLEEFGVCVRAMLATVPDVFAAKNGGAP